MNSEVPSNASTPDRHIKSIMAEMFGLGTQDYVFYSATEMNLKYSRFCKALELKSPPNVIVMDGGDSVYTGGRLGSYILEYNAIIIPKRAFRAFLRDDLVGDHVVAHELGHAKSMSYSRRRFLEGAVGYTAALGVAVSAGRGSRAAIKAYHDHDKSNESETLATTALPMIIGGSAGWLSFRHMEQLLIRAEEFRAEDGALRIMGRDKLIASHALSIERDLRTRGLTLSAKEAFKTEVMEFATKHNQELSPTIVEALWIDSLVQFIASEKKSTPLKAIIKPDYYPGIVACLQHAARSKIEGGIER